jgi:hypothetical protein
MVPAIRATAETAFSCLRREKREAAVARVVLRALEVFASLEQRGIASVAYPKPLALVAVNQVQSEMRSCSRARR